MLWWLKQGYRYHKPFGVILDSYHIYTLIFLYNFMAVKTLAVSWCWMLIFGYVQYGSICIDCLLVKMLFDCFIKLRCSSVMVTCIFVCGRVPWLYQYWPGGFMVFVVLCPGTPEGSTGSGSGFKASHKTGNGLKSHPTDWEKPGIKLVLVSIPLCELKTV